MTVQSVMYVMRDCDHGTSTAPRTAQPFRRQNSEPPSRNDLSATPTRGCESLESYRRLLTVGNVPARPGNAIGKIVGLEVALPGNAGNRELQAPSQFATDPVQRIQSRTAASIFAAHLPHHHVGIRVNMKRTRSPSQGALQSFQQRYVLGHVVVLPADPLGNSDTASSRIFDDDPDTRRTRTPVGTAVHVGYQVAHVISQHPENTMRESGSPRQEPSMVLLCSSREKISTGRRNRRCGESLPFPPRALTDGLFGAITDPPLRRWLHRKGALTTSPDALSLHGRWLKGLASLSLPTRSRLGDA